MHLKALWQLLAMKQSKLQQHKTARVKYTKATDLGEGHAGEVTERYIIPTFVPSAMNIKAIDVTDLDEDDRVELEKQLTEYTEYYQNAIKTIFNFEDWQSHTQGGMVTLPPVKWRTFKPDNLVVLEE